MRWLQRLRMKALGLFRRQSESARLNDELQFHLDQQIAENVANGMSPAEARTAALRLFGNPTLLREQARTSWSWNWMEAAWRDLRRGSRTLRRTPGFSLLAILVMALGIGATTSLFTIVRSVLLKPLPFRDSGKLVMLYEHFHGDDRVPYNVVSPADYYDWREKTHGFEDMAAWTFYGANLTGEHSELPEVISGAAGSWNLFPLLGVQPALGRTFNPEEDRQGAPNVVLLSWSLYQGRFGGNPSILNGNIRLDLKPYKVIGVLPAWFTYPDPSAKLWVPYAANLTPEQLHDHSHHLSLVVARPKSDVSAAAALQEVGALQYRLHMAELDKPVADEVVLRPMIEDVVEDAKTPLIVLLAAVGCMLLIACLNVSNLLVARSAARRKEVAIRGALGGSRLALIREQMMETLLICTSGGMLGLVVSFSATKWLAAHWQDLPRADAIHVDGTVLAFCVGLVVLTALVAGLLPAISSTGRGLLTMLQESSRSIGGSASRAALRKILLTAEIALTVILLVSAGLLFKSFIHLRTSDLGCATENVLTLRYFLPSQQYDTPQKIVAFHESLVERVKSLPGVEAAGLVSTAPGAGYEGDTVFTIRERPTNGPPLAQDTMTRKADPGYFNAMQIPLLSGRVFTAQDRFDRMHYAVINKKFADQYFAGDIPLGKHINIAFTQKLEDYEIIGVVGNTPHDVAQPVRATMYFPMLAGIPNLNSLGTLVVRTSGDPLALSVPVQKQVAALDAQLPVFEVLTMQQIIGKATASKSFSASLVLAFAILSLLLAAIGLYGVLSYLVTQRTSEIGIRMALGAQRSQVLRLILMDGMRPLLIGLVIGIGGGVGAGMLIKSLLYGTQPLDPMVFTTMIGTLLLTGLLASALPALRAARVQPVEALRTE